MIHTHAKTTKLLARDLLYWQEEAVVQRMAFECLLDRFGVLHSERAALVTQLTNQCRATLHDGTRPNLLLIKR